MKQTSGIFSELFSYDKLSINLKFWVIAFLSAIISNACTDFDTISRPGKDMVSQSAGRSILISTRMADENFDDTKITPTRIDIRADIDQLSQHLEKILVENLNETLHPDSNRKHLLSSPKSLAKHIAINDNSGTSKAKDFIYQYKLDLTPVGSGITRIILSVEPIDKNALRKIIRESNPNAVFSTVSILRYWVVKEIDFNRFQLVKAFAPTSFEGPPEQVGIEDVTAQWNTKEKTFEMATMGAFNEVVKDRNSIKKVQEKLNLMHYPVGKADGKIGPKTKKAIANFQKDHDLEPTGVLNSITLQTLLEIKL